MSDRRTTLAFDFEIQGEPSSDSVRIGKTKLRTTAVFTAYWRFAAERQRIFFRRLRNDGAEPLTSDPVLERFKFTNTYRASDRVSQYLIRNVIYRPDLPNDEVNIFFRTLLFKLFNKIETWQLIESTLNGIAWETFDIDKVDAALSARMAMGKRIYSAAYIMPSAGRMFGYPSKHQNHLRLLQYLVKHDYPARLASCASMASAFELLRSVPSFGFFLAYQFATDLNYSSLTDFTESEFVVAGPGALDGIGKCFENAGDAAPEAIIRYMFENQDKHFEALGINFEDLWGRPLQLIDCQNVFCEISKYARVAFPSYESRTGRTRIKQKFHLSASLPPPWYPPKWDLNGRINHTAPQ